ncbi:HAD-IIIC family phosphatase [Acetobacteraceae bacterium]|nr:HAD-IIIC family phosphatase [Acetobacteraceae bacterium]
MNEAIRLVIWDLDETFWQGTLSEGEISNHHGEIVRELNQRGIMNSICSKNDLEVTKKRLIELDLWDQFIFPSINWSPKGQRVADIVKKVQLRPESILFLDDNAMNLAEVKDALPPIQVRNETYIPQILTSEFFKGKPDPELKRLANYKIMEKKDSDFSSLEGNNIDFLRKSGITVEIDYHLEENLDRIIEIINRTNQLNFTKKRFSDEIEIARQQAKELIHGGLFEHTGLVRVRDNYGDYGFVGFFQQIQNSAEKNRLNHFCFSCRILSMHVETWLYRKFGSPELEIKGEVANNPLTDDAEIDWIHWYDPNSLENISKETKEMSSKPALMMIGGCSIDSIQHYVNNVTPSFDMFINTVRDNFIVRRDHSHIVRIAAEQNTKAQETLLKTGYKAEDFALSFKNVENALIVFAFWADISFKTYKLSGMDAFTPYAYIQTGHSDFQDIFEEAYLQNIGHEETIETFRFAKANLEPQGDITGTKFKENLEHILETIDPSNKVLFLLPALEVPDHHPEWGFLDRARLLSMCQIEVARKYSNVTCIDFGRFVLNQNEITDYDHFTRIVYQRCGFFVRETYNAHYEALKEETLKSAAVLFVKNEASKIAAWIAWHLSIGFNKIIIYDDSTDGTYEICESFSKFYPVECRHADSTLSPENLQKRYAYGEVAKTAADHYDWLSFLDINEAISLEKAPNINAFLKDFSAFNGLVVSKRHAKTAEEARSFFIRPKDFLEMQDSLNPFHLKEEKYANTLGQEISFENGLSHPPLLNEVCVAPFPFSASVGEDKWHTAYQNRTGLLFSKKRQIQSEEIVHFIQKECCKKFLQETHQVTLVEEKPETERATLYQPISHDQRFFTLKEENVIASQNVSPQNETILCVTYAQNPQKAYFFACFKELFSLKKIHFLEDERISESISFNLIKEGNQTAFQSPLSKVYMTSLPGGLIEVNRDALNPWELFTLKTVESNELFFLSDPENVTDEASFVSFLKDNDLSYGDFILAFSQLHKEAKGDILRQANGKLLSWIFS